MAVNITSLSLPGFISHIYFQLFFGIDKRKVHLSALICSGQMTKDEAINEMSTPYPLEKIEEDKAYVLKKLGLSVSEFESIVNRPPKNYLDYPTYYPYKKLIKYTLNILGFKNIIYDEWQLHCDFARRK